jgi:hypothetical protein
MIDPIGFNPSHLQYLYQPEGTPAVNTLPKDINLQPPGSVSDSMTINNEPKFGDALLGKTTRDCKT